MPERNWTELFQFASECKKLTNLDLSSTPVGEAGFSLAQSIKLSPSLCKLHLMDCSIPEHIWFEMLQSLSSCKRLFDLDLSKNKIGKAGHYLARSITSWGNNPKLQTLYLPNCSIPVDVWSELLWSLSSCKKLSRLDLSHNIIGETGHYLSQTIRSWDDHPPLELLDLSNCSIPEPVWPKLFKYLSSCKQLRRLRVEGNNVTGCLSSFLSDPHPGLPSLEYLNLKQTVMNKSDIQHLTHLIQNNKLPCLMGLSLKEKKWTDVEDELEQLTKSCRGKTGLILWLRGRRKTQQVQNESLFPQQSNSQKLLRFAMLFFYGLGITSNFFFH